MSSVLKPLAGAVAPERLGWPFRWMFGAGFVMNLGDGVLIAAGPLLVAAQTRDPFLVSLAFFCEVLPSLVFGSFAGVVVDRLDRRRIVILVNLARAAILALLSVAVATGSVNIALVLGALLVLGTAETFGDLAASSMLPRLVAREDIGLANARLQGSFLLTNQLVGPPIGAFLFAAGMAIPFAANAVAFAFGAVLVSRIAASFGAPAETPADASDDEPGPASAGAGEPGATMSVLRSVGTDLAEGVRWLRSHPPMRTLVLTIVAFNVTWGAAWSVLVLYAGDRLGMDSVGFGLLTTAMAIGGVIGTASYGRLERRFSLGDIMRVGLLIETLTHLTLALTRSPAMALVTMVVFGMHAFVWGTTATTIRQRAVPDSLMGRVGGLYRVGVNAGIVIGTPIGGLLARGFGITAPFWFAFVGSAVLVVLMWRQFGHIAHDDDEPPPEPASLAKPDGGTAPAT
ncbi:MAG TPA: MFS transporter [Candidatus Limnocylindria bacterium]|nr:MFS transporter [Candidatus Limnocylindria bacterium]